MSCSIQAGFVIVSKAHIALSYWRFQKCRTTCVQFQSRWTSLKLPIHSQLINDRFSSKNLAYRKSYIIINASYEDICVAFEEKQHNIGVPTFKLPASAKHILK